MRPTYPRIIPDRDEINDWYLDEEVIVTLANGDVHIIDKGFKFDSHSVPFWARLLVSKYISTQSNAVNDVYCAMVHDYLIACEHWLPYTRKIQDDEYRRFHNMPEYKISSFRCFIMPLAVRVWGWLKYDLWGDFRGDIKDGTTYHFQLTTIPPVV